MDLSAVEINWPDVLERGPASEEEVMTLASCDLSDSLLAAASELRDREHGDIIIYSRNVFIPLTHLLSQCLSLLYIHQATAFRAGSIYECGRGTWYCQSRRQSRLYGNIGYPRG